MLFLRKMTIYGIQQTKNNEAGTRIGCLSKKPCRFIDLNVDILLSEPVIAKASKRSSSFLITYHARRSHRKSIIDKLDRVMGSQETLAVSLIRKEIYS